MKARTTNLAIAVVVLALTVGACAKKVAPVAKPAPTSAGIAGSGGGAPPGPPEPVAEPTLVPPLPVPEDVGAKSLDDLNRESPLQPVFFELDSAELNADGQGILQGNADVLKRFAAWQITIEGHCDERGSAEHNLALGERRALAARDYLISLGVPATRVRTVSYGKEFPFDPSANEAAYAKNRRAHFVITAK